MNRVLLPGSAAGTALVLDEPLSMWGGLDAGSGQIIDRRHPQAGCVVTDAVLFLPWGRGSSSASSVLAEAIRRGTAPRAIVLAAPDDIILLGAIAAEELYGITCPVVVIDRPVYDSVATGDAVVVDPDGSVSITPRYRPPMSPGSNQ